MNDGKAEGSALIGLVIIIVLIAAAATAVYNVVANHKAIRTAAPAGREAKKPEGALRGTALTPREYTAAGFADFYQQAKAAGTSVSWHGDWAELADPAKAPHVLMKTVRQQGLEPIILVGTHTEAGGQVKPLRPLSPQTLAAYKQSAVDFARTHKPRFFGMGNEVDGIAKNAPADFEALVTLVNETTLEIKQASPDTRVFVTFQLERLKGLNGGLFGGRNSEADARWDLLARFETDVLAFTTYPGLIYHSPAEIPPGYYEEIRSKTNKPVAFSEVGWPAESIAPGWPSDADLQRGFTESFLKQVGSLKPEFTVWLMLYDQPGAPPAFRAMGLVDSAGNRRPALDAWKQ